MTGFYNPDGKSCSITAALALLQYIKPFMEVVASKTGALCEKLYEVKKRKKTLSKLRSLNSGLAGILGIRNTVHVPVVCSTTGF